MEDQEASTGNMAEVRRGTGPLTPQIAIGLIDHDPQTARLSQLMSMAHAQTAAPELLIS